MLIGTVEQIWRYPVKSMAGQRLSQCTVGSLGLPGDRGWAIKDEIKSEVKTGTRIPLLMQCSSAYAQEPSDENIPHVIITFPDGSSVASDDSEINARLSAVLGRQVRLWPRQPASNKEHYRRPGAAARVIAPLTNVPGFRALLPTLTKLPNLDATLRAAFSRTPDEPIPDISKLPKELFEFTSPLGTYFDAFPIHVLTTASLAAMRRSNPAADWDVRRFRPNFFVKTVDGVEGLVESEWAGKSLRIGSVEVKCEMPAVRCGMTTNAQAGLAKDNSVLRTIVKEAQQNLGVYASVTGAGQVSEGDQVELL
ncbi:MAG TPA: MOSC N-terminal beta barrel domain-containing protein [Pyrinomonadaceae bacterium]|nr:MOSC N-terminal beta barrel domain-containing protein [Pyrinomonadaceae bacterium]